VTEVLRRSKFPSDIITTMAESGFWVVGQHLASNKTITLSSKDLYEIRNKTKTNKVRRLEPFRPKNTKAFRKKVAYGRICGTEVHKYFILLMGGKFKDL